MLNLSSRICSTIAAAAVVIATAVHPAAAVDLKLERRSAEAGRARVCVVMDAKGETVAGTQNDIGFDPSCATLSQADCVASKHHGKPLHGSIPPSDPATYRSLVFALDNVDPMAEGEVYCCEFAVSSAADGCCAVTIGRLGASDPTGVALDATSSVERVCLIGDAPPPAAGVDPPGAAAAAPPAAAAPAPTPATPNWVWVVGLAAVVLVVLFFALRRAG